MSMERSAIPSLVGEAASRGDREGGASASLYKFAPAPPSPTFPRERG